MSSHFMSIGFAIEADADLQRYMSNESISGAEFYAKAGRYVLWPSEHPSQLWLQLDNANNLVGINPHFAGRAMMRVKLENRLGRDEDYPLDGGFQGWADPAPDGATGAYPLVFDAPDFTLHSDLILPTVANVQLAAFAHSVAAYPSEQAFHELQTSETRFAARSFIPSGLFGTDEEPDEHPPAHAWFNGVVLETALLTNPVSGMAYRWAWVSTLGGEVDVVCDPNEVAGEIVAGGVIRVSGWPSGRIVPAE